MIQLHRLFRQGSAGTEGEDGRDLFNVQKPERPEQRIGADRALGQDHIVGGGVLRQLKGLIQRQLVPGGDVCQCQPLRLRTFLQAGKDGVFGLAVPFHPEVGD